MQADCRLKAETVFLGKCGDHATTAATIIRLAANKPNNGSGSGSMVPTLTEKYTKKRTRRVQRNKKEKREMVLAVSDTGDIRRGNWILDNGTSRHRKRRSSAN